MSTPLRRLWRYAGPYRPRVVKATVFTVFNKLADVLPELVIGAAVDVVVRGADSFIGRTFGMADRFGQLVVLAGINFAIWLIESITEYIASLEWRNLAQTIEHDARMDAYRHVQQLEQAWFEDRSTGGLLSILNDDVNQLERFLDIGASDLIRTFVNVVFVGCGLLRRLAPGRLRRLSPHSADRVGIHSLSVATVASLSGRPRGCRRPRRAARQQHLGDYDHTRLLG